MSKIKIDMWYGDAHTNADKIDISWSDCDCCYRGNIYKAGIMIGDYSAKDFKAIERAFSHLNFNKG